MAVPDYSLLIHGVEASLSVYSFQIEEALNAPYQLHIEFTCTDAALPLSQMIDKAAQFSIEPQLTDFLIEAGQPRHWFGIISRCERHKTSADETQYSCLIEPRIARLKEHTASRLFQNKSVPDIIDSLLRHHGFTGVDFQIKTTRDYPVREYTTQYNEDSLAFLSRLLEDEGMWYQFVMDSDKEIVIFGDNLEHYRRSQLTIPYRENAGLESVGKEALYSFEVTHRPALAQVKLRDYNYRSANTNLLSQSNSPVNTPGHRGSLYLWGQHHKTVEEGQIIAKIRHEASIARQITALATGNAMAFAPGLVFQTQPEYVEAEYGWLITRIHHSASRKDAYQNTFEAMPSDRVYRPPHITRWPQIDGSLPARVTSPGNYQYAYIDQDGRYRVRLPFDLDKWSPGGDSRPVRLAKTYAGPDYGQHFPIHDGTEVMLSFVDGDPDRPYISGTMHNSVRKEHVFNEWNTRNVIRTWANNKLRMEDKVNEEHIKLATEYGKTQLNLGHLVDKQRKKRGEGFELRTDEWGTVRAGKGLFLSSDNQAGASGEQLDMRDAIRQIEQALALAKSLDRAAKSAQNHPSQSEVQKAQLDDSLKQLQQAGMLVSAPKGIASSTPESQLHYAGENMHQISGDDHNISAGGHSTMHAGESIALYAQGEGIKAYANNGKVDIQAQHDELLLSSLKDTKITSNAGKTVIAAKEEVLLTSGGAYIRIKDGEIELGCPKAVRVRAMGLVVEGPNSLDMSFTQMPLVSFNHELVIETLAGKKLPDQRFVIIRSDGARIEGKTDAGSSTGIDKSDVTGGKLRHLNDKP